MRRWTQKEINFLTKNYEKKLNKELIRFLNRNRGSIDYMASKIKLKKDYNFYCKSRKKYKRDFTKNIFEDLYYHKNKSIREIAKELKLGKNTVAYYFNKYHLKTRNHSESNKIRALKYPNWRQGLNKKTDFRIFAAAEKAKITCYKKREEKFRKIEKEFGKSISDLINDSYWKENLTQESVAKKLGLSREKIIELMKEFDISKRPNYEYISNLKGDKHPLYGKKWEDLLGIEKTRKRKEQMSLRARKNIIRRLKNQEMPFLNTKIEKKIANELIKRKLAFSQQYVIDKKFVCDFAIPPFNIIIECDGDYWHANPQLYNHYNLDKRQKVNINRDKYKDFYLSKKGWKVFRFFESDIHKSVKDCIDKVESYIKEQVKSIKNPLDTL